jgi:hypothetical protein
MASDNLSNIRKILQLVAFALIAYLLFRTVKACNGLPTIGRRDTTNVKRDTVVFVVKTDTIYKIEPEFVGVTNTIHVPTYIHDTLETFEVRVDTVKAVTAYPDYMAVRYYSDTQRLARGTVIIQDSVTQNKIKLRRLQTFGTDTTITNTVTLKQPKRLVMYFGVSGMGSQKTPLFGAGMDLSVKWRDDRIFTTGVILNRNDIFYQAGVKWPIRLRKQ